MTALYRSRTTFSGLSGGPGVATMYFLDTDNMTENLQALWTGLKGVLPIGVTIQVENVGDIIESTTGALTGAWGGTVQSALTGASNQPYPAPAGYCINWLTGTILDGHRLRGRTFVVPVTSAFYQDNGTILDSAVADGNAAVTTFIIAESSSLVIWHRPFDGTPAVPASGTKAAKPARPAHLGGHGLVTGGFIRDKVAILRSRRG